MAKFKGIVYLSKNQYESLYLNGSLTVNGVTYEYDENVLYVTDGDYVEKSTSGTSTEVYAHIGNTETLITVSSLPTAGNVAVFDENAKLKTSTPTENNDCVNKGYLDSVLGENNPLTEEELIFNSSNKTILTTDTLDWDSEKEIFVLVNLVYLDENSVSNTVKGFVYLTGAMEYAYLPVFTHSGSIVNYASVYYTGTASVGFRIVVESLPTIGNELNITAKDIKYKIM